MSRAFVKELDPVDDPPPEREMPSGPNYVTRRGADAIARKVSDLESELAASSPEARARLLRDLHYWQAQAASAEIVTPATREEIGFGARVTIARANRVQVIQLVGEAEADPATGKISWRSPLAQVLLGARAGESVELGTRTPPEEIKILSVEFPE